MSATPRSDDSRRTPPTLEEIRHAVASYQKRGWFVLEYPVGDKYPTTKGWYNKPLTPTRLAQLAEPINTGIQTGLASNGAYDLDCDADEAVLIAQEIALPTGRTHGRFSKGIRHRWYEATDKLDHPTEQWQFAEDPNEPNSLTMYVELRGGSVDSHSQTMVPPSLHPEGERVIWFDENDLGQYPYHELRERARLIATITLIARHWPAQGSRNTTTMALAGGLVRAGWLDSDIDEFTQLAAKYAHDEEWRKRKNAADARAKLEAGKHATGFPRLADCLRNGERVVEKLCEWLDLDTSQFGSGLPRIPVSGRALRDVEEASRNALEQRQESLPDHEQLYIQDGVVVWARQSHEHGREIIKIEPVRTANLAIELSRSADYMGYLKGRPSTTGLRKTGHVQPPPTVTAALVASRDWKLPNLRLVTSIPILHKDGSVVTTPGYAAATQALYWPATPLDLPPIPEHPTQAEALQALAALQEPFAEFPLRRRGKPSE